MSIQIKELRESDYEKAIDFTLIGMHFDAFFEKGSKLARDYAESFWYDELAKSNEIIAAYDENGEFAGVLLAEIYGKEKLKNQNIPRANLQDESADSDIAKFDREYEKANNEMLVDYRKNNEIDGELCLFAVDPNRKGQGIGSILLAEFEARAKGKNIFLYTDSNCTYQFYEKRGFERVGERDINLGDAQLSCYLYHKMM